ncbi:MAG: tetratricopeptide repeat protein [Acidobacteria bacterium]|nr:tetratricopeptide repeat protein [Acidobacteriota bacterium]
MLKTGELPILFTLLLAGTASLFASQEPVSPESLFSRGNAAYQKGDFAAAEGQYRRVLDSGFENGPLYFNLGNACFKQKRLGAAIFYWEKAQRLLPSDREIRENLELANLLIVDRIEIPEDPFPFRLLKRIRDLLTIRQESRLVPGMFLASNILFFLYIVLEDSRRALRALTGFFIAGALTALLAGSLAWKIYERDFLRAGIVLEQKVDVLSGPSEENIAVFTIHEGTRVRVHATAGGWHQISLPNGWNGWLPQSAVGIL